jgi:hypothetical protein|eukprot:COSAG01_NODE_1743_length_9354_cov_76.987574_8_plen_73_part_00
MHGGMHISKTSQIHSTSLMSTDLFQSPVWSCCTIVRAENSAVRLQSNFNRKLELPKTRYEIVQPVRWNHTKG